MPDPSRSERGDYNFSGLDAFDDFKKLVGERLPDLDLSPWARASLIEEVAAWLVDIRNGRVAKGASPDEAAREALDALGDDDDWWRVYAVRAGSGGQRAGWRESARVIGTRFFGQARHRLLDVYPLAIIGTLGLSLGLSVAVFAIVKAVLLDPLPFPESDRVMFLAQSSELGGGYSIRTMVPSYFDHLEHVPAFEQLAMFRWIDIALETRNGPQRVRGTVATASLLETVGVDPLHGRTFNESDAVAGAENKIILGHDLWQEEFSGLVAVVGTKVLVDGLPFEVVGIMPEGFGIFRLDAQFWIPAVYTDAQRADSRRNSSDQYQIGRLDPGATVADAQAQLDALDVLNRERFPELTEWRDHRGVYVSVHPLRDVLVREVRPILLVISAGSALVLVATLVNLIGLAGSRARRLKGNWGVRVALGARRSHIARRNLVQTAPWCAAGGVVGIGIAHLVLGRLAGSGLEQVPRAGSIDIDLPVILMGLGTTAIIGLAMGLIPVLGAGEAPASRPRLSTGGPTRMSTGGVRFRSFFRVLAATQIGIAFVVVLTAGLMFTGLRDLLGADPGFRAEGIVTLSYDLPVSRYSDPTSIAEWTETLIARTDRIAGVTDVGVTHLLPFGGREHLLTVWPEDNASFPTDRNNSGWYYVVSTRYLETMDIELLQGRFFTEADMRDAEAGGPSPVIVDDILAQRLWPHQNALGQRMHFALSTDRSSIPAHEVVGVVESVRHQSLAPNGGDRRGAAYVLHTDPQHTPRSYTLVVRTDRSVESIDREVAAVTRDLDPDLPLYEVRSLSDRIEDTLAPRRFALALVTLFASVAAGLAATGVHGVLAEAASTRRREFGIRMALGGTRRQIIALVLRETATWVTIGLAFGLAVAALARGRLARTGIDFGPHEIVIWLLAAGLLVATSLVALVGPALRITRIDPVDVLAEE